MSQAASPEAHKPTARECIAAAFAVGCLVGSTAIAALTAYGLLRVHP